MARMYLACRVPEVQKKNGSSSKSAVNASLLVGANQQKVAAGLQRWYCIWYHAEDNGPDGTNYCVIFIAVTRGRP